MVLAHTKDIDYRSIINIEENPYFKIKTNDFTSNILKGQLIGKGCMFGFV